MKIKVRLERLRWTKVDDRYREKGKIRGFKNNSDHSVSPHKRKTSLNKRLYIEVKCEQACSLVMLAEPDMDQRRQNRTYGDALPKAMYHVFCMTNVISWMCGREVSVGQRPTTAEKLDDGS
jgi:hypothetical protein